MTTVRIMNMINITDQWHRAVTLLTTLRPVVVGAWSWDGVGARAQAIAMTMLFEVQFVTVMSSCPSPSSSSSSDYLAFF